MGIGGGSRMNRRGFLGVAGAVVASGASVIQSLQRESDIYFAPRPRISALDWFRENISTMDGRPYDHGAYPHLGAPGGPCDALDDPHTLTIWLQWASRLGKTFFGQAASLMYADVNPCPMMFASESEKLAVEVVQRTYKMIERCKPLRSQLRPVLRRRQSQVDLDNCRMFVGWARSVSTLADKAVRLGHANEIDKWEHQSTSKEADPLKLFQDRGKEFPSRKFIFESTPTVKGRSRIERGRLASTNCHYYVPCPHCKAYQQLFMDSARCPNGKGGIVWEHLPNGKSDKEKSRSTAHYVCDYCQAKIKDEHRAWMMRRGVWAPEGCGVDSAKALEVVEGLMQRMTGAKGGDGASVDDYVWRGWGKAPWITGEPTRDGRDAGYQLSSLYALSLGWGDVAAEFVESKEKQQNLRNFINQWLAETWEIVSQKTTWQQLGERIIDNEHRRDVVPSWASMLTVGIDRQTAGGERFPYVVKAWGQGRRNATICYGEMDTFAQLQELLNRPFGNLRSTLALMDSGHKPDGVYKFVRDCARAGLMARACKGSGRALEADYWINTLGKDSSDPGMPLVHVDTLRSQAWMDRMLHVVKKGEDGAFSLHAGSLYDHQDYLEQLLNDAVVSELDSRNNERENWERIDTQIPNDFRDCERYAYCAMLVATRGADIRPPAEPAPKRSAVVSAGVGRPDGRPFV